MAGMMAGMMDGKVALVTGAGGASGARSRWRWQGPAPAC
jgi:hypothetical protein